MSLSLDLSLPSKASTEKARKEGQFGETFAVYTLVELGTDSVGDLLLREVEGDDPLIHSTCMLAPKYDFSGQSLKAVCSYHLELEHALEKDFHPSLFIVAISQNYKDTGVLLIDLSLPDTCLIESKEAACALVNVSIGSMDWEDFKEIEEIPASLAELL